MVVASVDGVNILNGETASWDQSGYVFNPFLQYQRRGAALSLSRCGDRGARASGPGSFSRNRATPMTPKVTGWRKSDTEVVALDFSAAGDSPTRGALAVSRTCVCATFLRGHLARPTKAN